MFNGLKRFFTAPAELRQRDMIAARQAARANPNVEGSASPKRKIRTMGNEKFLMHGAFGFNGLPGWSGNVPLPRRR